jgi:hypothetical protein
MKATLLLVLAGLSISIAQATEPKKLTLACQGTATINGAKPEPISFGITVNFTTRMVEGFGYPFPVKIHGKTFTRNCVGCLSSQSLKISAEQCD